MDRLPGDTQEEFTLKAVRNCRRALMSGITSARDVGARFGINISTLSRPPPEQYWGPMFSFRRLVAVSGNLAGRPHQVHRDT